jgi:uncharacterized protein
MGGVPVRTCIACRAKRPQTELIRIARSRDGRVAVDERGGAPGRGAYVCPGQSCIDRALASDGLRRALRHGGALPGGLHDELTRIAREFRKGN